MKRVFSTDKAPKALGPYSQATLGGDLIFVSGQIPLRPDGSMNDGSIEEQTKQVMENIEAILETTRPVIYLVKYIFRRDTGLANKISAVPFSISLAIL